MNTCRPCCFALLLSAFLVGCLDLTSDEESEGRGDALSQAPGDGASCRNVPLPPTEPAPESIVGTWLLDSFDVTSAGSSPGNAWHIQIPRERQILAVTFAANGTWQAARCMGDEKYETCSAWCEDHHGCMSGNYTYENGQLESQPPLANAGKQAVYTTATGLTVLYFYATMEWANFVKIDHLTPCQ